MPEPTQKTTPERRASEQFRHVLLSEDARRMLLKIQKGRAQLGSTKPIYAVRNRETGRLHRILAWSERCAYRALVELSTMTSQTLLSSPPCQKCDFCIEEKGLDSNKFKVTTVPTNKLPALVEEWLKEHDGPAAPTGVTPVPKPKPKKPRALDLQEAPTPVKSDRWGPEHECPEIEVAIVPPPPPMAGPQDKFLHPPGVSYDTETVDWGRSYVHFGVAVQLATETVQQSNSLLVETQQVDDEFAQAIQEGLAAAMRTGLVQHVAPPPASTRRTGAPPGWPSTAPPWPGRVTELVEEERARQYIQSRYEGRAELYPVPAFWNQEVRPAERVVADHPLYAEGARNNTAVAPYRQDWQWGVNPNAQHVHVQAPSAQLDPRFLPRQNIRRMTGTLVPEHYSVERASSVFLSAHEWRPQLEAMSPSLRLSRLDQAGPPNWGVWRPRQGDVGEHQGTIWTGTRFAYLLKFGDYYACFSADGIQRVPREGERLEHQWESEHDHRIARTVQFCIHCGRERRPDTETLDCSRRTRR